MTCDPQKFHSACATDSELSRDTDTTVPALIRRHAVEKPDEEAFVFLRNGEEETDSLTYFELASRTGGVAAALRANGLAGERVLLMAATSPEFVVAFFGCMCAGVIPVPVHPPNGRRTGRFAQIAADCDARAALTSMNDLDRVASELEANARRGMKVFAIEMLLKCAGEPWQTRTEDQSVALLQYTSGSTGDPKGVMVTHANLRDNAHLIQKVMSATPNSTGLSWLPLYHDMGLIGTVIAPLYAGSRSILMPPATFIQKPLRWLRAISRFQASHSGGPNFAYDLAVEAARKERDSCADGLDLSCWKVAFNGAEPVHERTLRRFTETFSKYGFLETSHRPCYGMAETTLMICGNTEAKPQILALDAESLAKSRVRLADHVNGISSTIKSVSVGRCDPRMPVVIVNPDTRKPCVDGEVGEIWVSGNSVARGYWNKPRETKEAFRAQLADGGRTRYLRTGDLGFFYGDHLHIAGRLKDLIIVRGVNHFAHDLERTVEQCDVAFRNQLGAAFAVEQDDYERLVVVQEISREAIREGKYQSLIKAVHDALLKLHGVNVDTVVLVKPGGVPRTSSGKVRRRQCRQDYQQRMLPVVAECRLALFRGGKK